MKIIKASLNLDNWITYLIIFTPIVILIIIYNLPFFEELHYGTRFIIENVIQFSTITFLYSLQFSLGRKFFKEINKKAYFYNINGVLPLLFWVVVCIWIVYKIPSYFQMSNINVNTTDDNSVGYLISILFLFHYLITYFIINTLLVRYNLKKVKDLSFQKQLNAKYYKPLKTISGISWMIFSGILIYAIIYYAYTH